MKKNKFSINDIASQLNISKTTVSFILNGKSKEKRISEELTNKVLSLIETVGYSPNQFAQGLRTGKSKIIGLMVENISDTFFAAIARYIEDRAYAQGYKIIYCSTENDKKRALDFLKMFQQLGVDGYIITAPAGIETELQNLVSEGKEIVLFDRVFKDIPCDYVITDNYESSFQGTQHLIGQGFRNISFITLSSDQPQMMDRLRGYQDAVEGHGLTPTVHKLPYANNYGDYSNKITDILKSDSATDAILFATGYLGVSGLEALAQLQIRIPEQKAIVSFDEPDVFRIHKPAITSIYQPLEKLAEALINGLLYNISQKDLTRVRTGTVLPAELRIRPSSLRHP